MSLEKFLTDQADRLSSINPEWPDSRQYVEDISPDAHPDAQRVPDRSGDLCEAWLARGTSYIWKVGILAQWDSNKCDWAHLLIGHERKPGRYEFIGRLYWQGGENDDVGRSLVRYLALARTLRCTVYRP